MSKVITGIGEILWDLLPSGKNLGGAPANFAYHASRLGAEGWGVSAVCDDPLGREIRELVLSKKLNNILADSDKPTGTVEVSLDDKGVPSYLIKEDVAWDNIPFNDSIKALAERTDAVCYGSLVQRMNSRDAVMKFLLSMRDDALKVFDINLRQHYYDKELIDASLKMADILKINDDEIKIVEEMFNLGADDVAACRELIENYGLKLVILTKGGDGSCIVTHDRVLERGVGKVEVVDTVGAGDAFTAAFTVAYLNGDSLERAQELATETASYVCSRKGAMPE